MNEEDGYKSISFGNCLKIGHIVDMFYIHRDQHGLPQCYVYFGFGEVLFF